MTKMSNSFLILLFCHQFISTSSEQIYPDFYKISYTSSYYPKIPGIYRKQDYEHNGRPVFKRTGINNYCLYVNDEGKWTLGVKYTRGDLYKNRLAIRDVNHDIPTSGEWIVQAAVGGSAKVDVTVTACSHPDYYEVHSPTFSYLDGFYKRLPKAQSYQTFPVFKKQAQSEGTEYTLFLHSDGRWKFGRGTSATSGIARSVQKNLPTPGLIKEWKIWDSGSWKRGIDFTVTPLNPEYPVSYTVSYHGEDQEMTKQLQLVQGIYEKQKSLVDDVPVYKNLENNFNIFLDSNGKWTLATNDYSLYQESHFSPTLIHDKPWKLSNIGQEFHNLTATPNYKQNQRNPKMMYYPVGEFVKMDTESKSKIIETSEEIIDTYSKTTESEASIGLILGISTTAVVLVIFSIVFAVVYRKRSRKARAEEPKIDENLYYGVDYDDNDADNAITDNNDYYE